jgi:two-component system, OmpR family, phosphate regulon sensor histidine kinase PhoR
MRKQSSRQRFDPAYTNRTLKAASSDRVPMSLPKILNPVAACLLLLSAVLLLKLGGAGTVIVAIMNSALAAALVFRAIDSADSETSVERQFRSVSFSKSSAAALLEGVPEPALLLDNASSVVAANNRAQDMLNIAPGTHITAALRAPALLSAIELASRDNRPQLAEFKLPAPVEQTLSAFVTPIDLHASGLTWSCLVVLRDRSAEEQLVQLRSDFVANASHELRTPLASVKGFIETLQDSARDDPEARQTFLAIMLEQTNRMSRLIDDLLSLSRVELRERVPPLDSTDLAGIAEHVVQSMQPIAASGQQKLVLETAVAPVLVTGDRDELSQVLQNLIQNAIKYGKPNGTVRVRASASHGTSKLSVTDDGIGISAEHLPRLTERFYRVSTKESLQRGGTGLGLAIVKHIVNRHRGSLEIRSEPGKGSTFTISLPTRV